MKKTDPSTGVEPRKTPFGKVMGIVENRDQLQAVSGALSKLGVSEIDVMDGSAGLNRLDDEESAVSNCFLGDMEDQEVKRYLHAVRRGLIVFAATAEPEIAEQVAKTAKALGATEIVHFGSLVITNY